MNFIRSFFIILFFAPISLHCHENDVDSLINQSIRFLKANQNDSLDFTLQTLVPIVVGEELDSLLILRQKSLIDQVAKTNIIKSKSQLQSLILLLICLTGFIYMIYYTDQKNREKQVKKIRAAMGISKYEYDLRKKISERLHDDIGGSIIALKMKCSDKKEMENEVKLLDDIYNNVRSLSSDLDIQHKFSQTIENGIDILVNEMCSSFKKTTVNVFPDSINEIDDQDLIQDVIMTVKELITNIIKHSKANEIAINVSFDKKIISILIEDNGKGTNNIEFGHGLTAINNRAILREGSLEFDSNKKGTSVSVEFKI